MFVEGRARGDDKVRLASYSVLRYEYILAAF